MRMMPAEVVTAHTEYSVWPREYRLSNTLAGSACHDSRGGGPGGRGGAAGRGAGVEGGTASVQIRLKTPAKSAPAAAFAAARCASTRPDDDCAMPVDAATPHAAAIATAVPATRPLMTDLSPW